MTNPNDQKTQEVKSDNGISQIVKAFEENAKLKEQRISEFAETIKLQEQKIEEFAQKIATYEAEIEARDSKIGELEKELEDSKTSTTRTKILQYEELDPETEEGKAREQELRMFSEEQLQVIMKGPERMWKLKKRGLAPSDQNIDLFADDQKLSEFDANNLSPQQFHDMTNQMISNYSQGQRRKAGDPIDQSSGGF